MVKGGLNSLHPGNSMWILAEELENDWRSRTGARPGKAALGRGSSCCKGLFHWERGRELSGITRMNGNDGIPGV